MKLLIKTSMFIMDLIIIAILIMTVTIKSFTCLAENVKERRIINIGVLLSNVADPFIYGIKQELVEIQKQNEGKVNFIFYDGKNNESVQKADLESLLLENIDLIILWTDPYKENIMEDTISKVKQKNIPIVIAGALPQETVKFLNFYNKLAFIKTDQKRAGTSQGEILADLWIKDNKSIDKNKDDILQYIMIKGKADNIGANDRAKNSVAAIKAAGIKTELLAEVNGDWIREVAKNDVYNLFLKYDGRIEAIISSSDDMAIGAVEAMQKYGYNKGNTSKFIPVVGFDGLPEAKALIDKGLMTGTVIQDPKVFTQIIYTVGMNLVNGLNPTQSTDYKYNNGFVIAELPYNKYTKA